MKLLLIRFFQYFSALISELFLQDFWELEAVRKLFDEKFTRNVGHEIDGLIFQPVNEVSFKMKCMFLSDI